MRAITYYIQGAYAFILYIESIAICHIVFYCCTGLATHNIKKYTEKHTKTTTEKMTDSPKTNEMSKVTLLAQQ